MRWSAVIWVLLGAVAARADVGGGVRAFRDARYEDAAKLLAGETDPEARFFEGAALYKLNRPEEALEAVDEALQRDPALAGEVGELYRGLVLYELKLYRAARPAFARVVELNPSGKLAGLASQHLAQIDALPADRRASAGWYLDHGLSAAAAGRPRVAVAYLAEAKADDPALQPELVALHLAAAFNALARPAEALAALGETKGAGPELERGRALVALGKTAEGRRALEASAASGQAPWAAAAKALLETVK